MEEKHRGKLYQATVSVSERERLKAYVKAAENAINGCDAVLNGSIPWEERVAMGNALTVLKLLRESKSNPELLNSSTAPTPKVEMSETHADLCEKCGSEIESTRTVDLTLKNEPRICDSCFVKEPLRPTQRKRGWTN